MKGHLDTTPLEILWYKKTMGECQTLMCFRWSSTDFGFSPVIATQSVTVPLPWFRDVLRINFPSYDFPL